MLRNDKFYREKKARKLIEKVNNYYDEDNENSELWESEYKSSKKLKVAPSEFCPANKVEFIEDICKYIIIEDIVVIGDHPSNYDFDFDYINVNLSTLKNRKLICLKNPPDEYVKYGSTDIGYWGDDLKRMFNFWKDNTLYKLTLPLNLFKIELIPSETKFYQYGKRGKGIYGWNYLYHNNRPELAKTFRYWKDYWGNRYKKYDKKFIRNDRTWIKDYEDEICDNRMIISQEYDVYDWEYLYERENFHWWEQEDDEPDDAICKNGCYDDNEFIF